MARRGRSTHPLIEMFIGLGFAIFGGVFAVQGLLNGDKLNDLHTRGVKIEAKAVDRNYVTTTHRRGRKDTDYFLRVRVTFPNGAEAEKECEVSKNLYDDYSSASNSTPKPVFVIYDPQDIQNWMVAGSITNAESGASAMFWIGLPVGIIGMGLAALSLRMHLKRARAQAPTLGPIELQAKPQPAAKRR